MKARFTILIIAFVFITLSVVVFIGIKDPQDKATSHMSKRRPVHEYLVGGVSVSDLETKIHDWQFGLSHDFWEAFKFMDQLILEGHIKDAMMVRNRAREMADFIELHLKRDGFRQLVSSHADIILEGSEDVVLDTNLDRTHRRVMSMRGLEEFWQDRFLEGLTIGQEMPRLSVNQFQASELAYQLRLHTELIDQEKGQVSLGKQEDVWKLIQYSADDPSALVQAERAMLLDEMIVSGFLNDKTVQEHAEEIIQVAILALRGQAVQQQDMLKLILRYSGFLPNDSAVPLMACQYVEKLGDQVEGRLFRMAMARLKQLGQADAAKTWCQRILNDTSQKFSELRGQCLALQALEEIDKNSPSKKIFDLFDEALRLVYQPRERADLLVDIALYERELSRDQKDITRKYLQVAVERFQEAAKLDVRHVAARVNLATISLRANSAQNAKIWLQELDLRRANLKQMSSAHLLWAEIYLLEGDKEKARLSLDIAERGEPHEMSLKLLQSSLE